MSSCEGTLSSWSAFTKYDYTEEELGQVSTDKSLTDCPDHDKGASRRVKREGMDSLNRNKVCVVFSFLPVHSLPKLKSEAMFCN